METNDADQINKPGNNSASENQHSPSETNAVNSNEHADPVTAINTSQLKIEMEVHHHPQLDHKSKPFKEYLLEGFMIFIAVMMGFFAENIRVNITNSEHVNQLTSQLVQDLKVDTARLNKLWDYETQVAKKNDSLIELLQQPLEKTDTKKMQKLIADSHGMWPFHSSGGAIAAIKNELSLKQFSNSDIIRYIAIYEEHIDLLHTVEGITLQYQRSYIDPFLTQHFTPSNMEASFDSTLILDSKMRNLNQEDMTQMASDMVLIKINTRELIEDNRMVKADAVSLLKYVTKHYHK